MSTVDPPPASDPTAAELALGLLTGEERAAALDRERRDTPFAAEVAWWRARVALLFADGLPLPSLWSSIVDRLPRAGGGVVARRTLNLWRTVAGAATAVATLLAVVLLQQTARPIAAPAPPSPTLVATLESSDRSYAVAVVFDPARQAVIATPVRTRFVPDAAELWLVPAAGAPRSLGLLPRDRATERAIDTALATLLRQGATLAISAEPRGGSRTGQPTGPVVLTGKLLQNADGAETEQGPPSKET